ncbi:MAG: class D beta-lactamase [Bacteroidota bacterium]
MKRREFGGWVMAAVAAAAIRPALAETLACTLVVDAADGRVLTRRGPCELRFSPCSTFKVPLALMGFDAGLLQDEHTPLLDYRPEFNGAERERKATDPAIWLRDSIIWYSRYVTRGLGAARLQSYADGFDYGNRDLTGDPGLDNGLTQAWLMSSLRVSADDQVRFLGRMLAGQLPVSARAVELTQAIIPPFQADGGWSVRGKTGSGWLGGAGVPVNENQPQGWFVGWAEKDGRRVLFARLEVADHPIDGFAGMAARKTVLTELAGWVG